MRTIIALILCVCTILCCASCRRQDLYEYCEFGLKLSSDYYETDLKETFDKAYTNDRVLIGINRMSFDACLENGILPTHTPKKFAGLYKERVEQSDETSEVFELGDVPFFTYKRVSDGVEYLYVMTFYCSQYAYFVVTFISPNTDEGALVTEFLEIANTMYFTYDVR